MYWCLHFGVGCRGQHGRRRVRQCCPVWAQSLQNAMFLNAQTCAWWGLLTHSPCCERTCGERCFWARERNIGKKEQNQSKPSQSPYEGSQTERYGRWLLIEFCPFFCNKNGWQFWDSSPCENGERRLCLPCWLCSLQLFTDPIVPRDMPGAIVEAIVSSTNVPRHLWAGLELRSSGRRNYFKLCQRQQRPQARALFSNWENIPTAMQCGEQWAFLIQNNCFASGNNTYIIYCFFILSSFVKNAKKIEIHLIPFSLSFYVEVTPLICRKMTCLFEIFPLHLCQHPHHHHHHDGYEDLLSRFSMQ